MRVLVSCDSIAGLPPLEASELVARAFADRGATVAVVPLGTHGVWLRDSLALADPAARLVPVPDSAALGEALRSPAHSTVLDLTGATPDDLGRGSLRLLDERPADALRAARRLWDGQGLVALVPEDQVSRPLTGLSGLAATEGRKAGLELSEVLAADTAAQRWAAELGVTPGEGSGAAGGLGLIVQAVGGRLADPLTLLAERFALARSLAQADLVVTGADSLDFHAVGGPVLQRVAAMAGEALRPVIAIVGRNFISARELRLAGLEAAYPVPSGQGRQGVTADEVASVAGRVADTWRW